ncbi:MAG: hypothetical protein SD837_06090 [Candidatus Electrothrix scaldis]|nr:MAG: hypothetical protein SD837_06090 [Candidatus Electrothrix sp. GW3-3]
MNTARGRFLPSCMLVLATALLALLPFNTVQAQSDGNVLSQIIRGLQPLIQPGQPQPATQPQAASGTCNARYEAVVTEVNGSPMSQVVQFGQFQSLGSGRMPVAAAKEAKENAERCMQSQWSGRANGLLPFECTDQQRISGYTVRDIERTLQQELCQAINPLPCNQGKADIRYSLFAVVDGGPGCGTRMSPVSRTMLASTSVVQCMCQDNRRGDRGWDRGRDGRRDDRGWGRGRDDRRDDRRGSRGWDRDERRGNRDWGRGRDDNRSGGRLSAPQQVTPVQGAVFYHLPRRTLLAWEPVQRAESYLVEIKYKGRTWNTMSTNGDATFVAFDFPGSGQGEWRVIPQGRRGRQGAPSPWSSFTYRR